MSHLPRERLGVSAKAMATTRAIFELTCDYCRDRTAFGKPLTANQHVRFELAEMATEIDIAEAYVDKSVHRLQRRRAHRRRRRQGQVVRQRAAEARRRPLPAAARRLRLHGRVPGCPRIRRHPRPDDLRRHDRDHEGDHRPRNRLARLISRHFAVKRVAYSGWP